MPFCPECKAEYREGIAKCVDCDVDLVPELLPEPEPEVMNEPFVPVFVYKDEMEAKIAKGVLEDAGIPVWERADIIKSLDPLTVGPLGQEELLVPESRADEARGILEEALSDGERSAEDR